jgi:acetolactate synthase-1/2/3 large subunit
VPRTIPGTLFRAGGSGLGWSLGAILGVGLARPQARTLTIVGDGGFLFGTPLPALLALQRAGVGGLVVVLQNGGYAASSRPVHELFPERGEAAGQPFATSFDAPLDVALAAQACGAVGLNVRDPGEIEDVLDRAVDAWRAGSLVVVGAHVSSPWIAPGSAH